MKHTTVLRAAVAAASLAFAAPSHAAPGAGPRLDPQFTVLEADEELTWRAPFYVINPLGVGLYLDSLSLEIEYRGTLAPGAPARSSEDATALIQSTGSVSAGDTAYFEYIGPALAESARVTFRLVAHEGSNKVWRLAQAFDATPGPYSRAHPSRVLHAGGRNVEFVLLEPRAGAPRPAPAVLLVHGHGASARPMLRAARTLANRGCFVGIVSQPGYGGSDGPADFMGPATVAAAEAALAELRGTAGVDSGRVLVWGFSRGATVAAILAARHPDLRGAIVQSGIYDLWATYRGTKLAGFREAIVAEAGRDSAGWRARSPLLEASRIRCRTLVLHGEKDDNVPVRQANAFAMAIRAGGTLSELWVMPGAGHVLPLGMANRAAFDFLDRMFAN